MKKVILALLAALMPALASAQATGRVEATLLRNYDVVATSYTYSAFGDQNAALAPVNNQGVSRWWNGGSEKRIRVFATASNTLAAVTAGQAPFSGLAVGDLLIFNNTSQAATTFGVLVEEERLITAKASNDSVTIDGAALTTPTTGVTFRYKKFFTGTAATDGWIDVSQFDSFNIETEVITIAATSLDVSLACRATKWGTSDEVFTKNYTAAGNDHAYVVAKYSQCRVGWRVNTDAGVQSVSVGFIGAIK